MRYKKGDIITPTSHPDIQVLLLKDPTDNIGEVVHLVGPHKGLITGEYSLTGTYLAGIKLDIEPIRILKNHNL